VGGGRARHGEDMATELRPQGPSAVLMVAAVLVTTAVLGGCSGQTPPREGRAPDAEKATPVASAGSIAEGKRIFRFDTFGDEQFWTDTLRLHEVVQTSVDPTTALKIG
jgi:hypothetical protein